MHCPSNLGLQSDEGLLLNLQRFGDGLPVGRKADCSTVCGGDGYLRGSGGERGIVKNEIQFPWREFFWIDYVKKVQIDEHQFPIAAMAQSFEHQVHPDAFARAVNLFADVAGHARELQGAEVFEGDKGGGAALAVGGAILE